jgi:hypothetical protein
MSITGSLKHDQDALTLMCVIDQELQAEIRSFLGIKKNADRMLERIADRIPSLVL